MATVKRRKIDNETSLVAEKKHVAKLAAPTSASSSPEPAVETAPKENANKEPAKTFKDLVKYP